MAKNDSLLPEDTDNASASAGSKDFDMSSLRVDFSSEESSSEARTFEPIPAGEYVAYIKEWEVRFSTSAKNPGKPYWNLQLQLVDDTSLNPVEVHKRVLFASVMLWSGAGYSLAQLLKATGFGDRVEQGSKTFGQIPNCDEIVQKGPFVIVVSNEVDKYAVENGGWDPASKQPKPRKNDVKGYKALDQLKAAGSKGNSLMP